MVLTLQRDMKGNIERINESEKVSVAVTKRLDDVTKDRNELRDKLTAAKDLIKKEREENRNR